MALLDEAQMFLVETPGIFAPKRRLVRAMVNAAWEGTDSADAILSDRICCSGSTIWRVRLWRDVPRLEPRPHEKKNRYTKAISGSRPMANRVRMNL